MGHWLQRIRAKATLDDPHAKPRADLIAVALMLDRCGVPPSVADGIDALYTNGLCTAHTIVDLFHALGVEHYLGVPDHPDDLKKHGLAVATRGDAPMTHMAALRPRILYVLTDPSEFSQRMREEVENDSSIVADEALVHAFYHARFGVPLREDVGIPYVAYAHMRAADLVWAARRGEEGFLARLRVLCPEDEDEKNAAWRAADKRKAPSTPKSSTLDKATAANVVLPEGNKKISEMTGFGEAGRWGMRLARDLRSYAQGELPWAEVDKGVLLVSPPGGGKSTFAKALAAECGLPLHVSNYGDWERSMSDRGYITRAMEIAFEGWRKAALNGPVIVFIDEIDSIGARGMNGHNDGYWAAVINGLLAFLDGAVPRDGIVVVAATNYPGRVDPALKRPGRLDRLIEIPMPDEAALAGMVAHHLGVDSAAADTKAAARALRGRSPAEVEQACREARRAAKDLGRKVEAVDVVDVLNAVRKKKSDVHDRMVCIHESGHAVAALAVGQELVAVEVDTVQSGDWLIDGHVACAPLDGVPKRADLLRYMSFLLAGRAAEEVHLGEASAGAQSDLRQATGAAQKMVRQSGLDGDLLYWTPDSVFTSGQVDKIRALVEGAYEGALRIVAGWRVPFLADRLRERRHMTGAEVKSALAGEGFFRSPRHDRDEQDWRMAA